ncbi:MAG: TetR/AcrR family transcriptional regulator [Myxococcota bacterium]
MSRRSGAVAPRGERGTRVPQQARSRRTRERILTAATACFEELGYDETTTAAIARRAGIAVGSVYGYFVNKRAILLELLHGTVEQMADGVVQGLAPAAWQGAEPRECVRKLLNLVFHARTVQPGVQRILWERFFKDAEFRAAMEAIENRIRGAIAELLTVLRDQGRTRIEDVATAAYVIHLSMEWTASRLMLGDSPVDIDAAVETASEMLSRFLFDDERL